MQFKGIEINGDLLFAFNAKSGIQVRLQEKISNRFTFSKLSVY
jgi:hypothetical protein